MKRIEVKNKEYNIVTLGEDMALYTIDLNDDIAYSICSEQLGKVGLARSLDEEQLLKFFAEINPDKIKVTGLLKVRIIGGADSEFSKNVLSNLVLQLQSIDNNDDIIDLISCDACEKIHPNSFELNCYHGGIRGIAS